MSPIVHKPPIVANTPSGVELLRQKLQRMREWNCPQVTQDPGFGQMPPGMLWIRTDLVGCRRYRFYDENGNVVTLCPGGGDTDTDTSDDSVILVKSIAITDGSPDVINNTTTETDFATTYAVPAETSAVGDLYRCRIYGTTRVDPLVNAGVRYRLYVNNYPIADTQNRILVAPNTNAPWSFDFDIIVEDLTNPEFGSVHVGGVMYMKYDSAISPIYLVIPFNSGNGVGIGWDYFSDMIIKVSADWDTADTEDEAELTMFSVMKGRVGGGL